MEKLNEASINIITGVIGSVVVVVIVVVVVVRID